MPCSLENCRADPPAQDEHRKGSKDEWTESLIEGLLLDLLFFSAIGHKHTIVRWWRAWF
jgi:hypothetical protein